MKDIDLVSLIIIQTSGVVIKELSSVFQKTENYFRTYKTIIDRDVATLLVEDYCFCNIKVPISLVVVKFLYIPVMVLLSEDSLPAK
jgi:hypothetical protein